MKLLLLGMTCTGKSTLAPKLANHYGLQVLEADDEVERLNGGIWPDSEAVIDQFFEQTTPRVLQMDELLYVISWLTKNDIKAFYEAGFHIVELHASYETIKARKVVRDDFAAYGEERLRRNFRAYHELLADPEVKSMFAVSVEGGAAPAELLQRVIRGLEPQLLSNAKALE